MNNDKSSFFCPHCETIQNCLQSSWFVTDGDTIELFTTNEVIGASGKLVSSPGSANEVRFQFMFDRVIVKAITLQAGQCTIFTVNGFDRIQLIGLGSQAMGDFSLITQHHPF
ncbi:S-Ena type endospore appendage [Paenibacillus sp. FSL H8-0034]|uniref:S-Ena type endospore appendage n=1 Tax=Paenibacillus sp. FSL H8-0034 TaxID=2954671 RepID=UPI0030FCDBDE